MANGDGPITGFSKVSSTKTQKRFVSRTSIIFLFSGIFVKAILQASSIEIIFILRHRNFFYHSIKFPIVKPHDGKVISFQSESRITAAIPQSRAGMCSFENFSFRNTMPRMNVAMKLICAIGNTTAALP